MGGIQLTVSRNVEHLFLCKTSRRRRLLYLEITFCYRPCLIHDYGFHTLERLDGHAAFKQDPLP